MKKNKRIGDINEPKLRNKSYYTDFSINGQRYRYSLKTGNKKLAWERLMKMHEDLMNKKFGIGHEITLKEALDRFLESKKGMPSYDTDLARRKNIDEYFGSCILLKDITKSHVKKFESYLKLKKNHRYNTIKHSLALIKAAINLAIHDGIYDGKNPVCLIKLKKIRSKSVKFSLEEMHKILEYTKKISADASSKSQRYVYAFVYISLNSGMRPDEVFNLQWRDVKPSYIIIRNPKSAQETEQIPNPPWLYNFIQSLHKDSMYIINTNQRKTDTFRKIWLKMKKDLSLHERSNWRSMRHSFASYLASQGVPLTVIQALLRHANLSTTEIYLHTNFDEMSKEMLKIKGAVDTNMSLVK